MLTRAPEAGAILTELPHASGAQSGVELPELPQVTAGEMCHVLEHQHWIRPPLVSHGTVPRGRLRQTAESLVKLHRVHSSACTKPGSPGLRPTALSRPRPLCLVQVTLTHRVVQRAGASGSPFPSPSHNGQFPVARKVCSQGLLGQR